MNDGGRRRLFLAAVVAAATRLVIMAVIEVVLRVSVPPPPPDCKLGVVGGFVLAILRIRGEGADEVDEGESGNRDRSA